MDKIVKLIKAQSGWQGLEGGGNEEVMAKKCEVTVMQGPWRRVGRGGCWSEGAASPEVCWTEGTVGPGAARKGACLWPRRQPPLLGPYIYIF